MRRGRPSRPRSSAWRSLSPERSPSPPRPRASATMPTRDSAAPWKRILYQVDDRIATISLNRPEKRNALDDQTVTELGRAFATADSDAEVRVILLRGEGPAFCAGADLAQLERIAAGAGPLE